MNVVNLKYRDIEDFLNHFRFPGEFEYQFSNSGTNKWIYRGESTTKYKLVPSALREKSEKVLNAEWGGSPILCEGSQIRCEYYKLWQFYKFANEHGLKINSSEFMRLEYLSSISSRFAFQDRSYKWLSAEYEELAALAQHYGMPTRMIDWSSDLLTSLYFASSGALKRWKKEELKSIETGNDNEFDCSDSLVIWALNGGLLHSMTKPLPLKIVVPSYYDNPNLNAQKGVLTYWEIEMPSRTEEDAKGHLNFPVSRKPLNELISEYDLGYESDHIDILFRIEVDVCRCERIYSVVNSMSYNAARLFPGYNGVVQKIEEDNIAFEFNRWLNNKRCEDCPHNQPASSGQEDENK